MVIKNDKIMTVVSSKEFVINQKKYFDLAVNEQVVIKRGQNRFHIICKPVEKTEKVYFEPDDDFYESITMNELLEKTYEIIDKIHENK